MQDIVFYAAANETLGMVRDYSNMNKSSAPVLTLGVAVCLRMRLFAGIKVPTPYPVASLNGITDWQWSMDADFDRSTTCKLVADAGGISVHTVTDTVNGETMSFTEFVIPISNMNTQELAAWLGNEGTKSGLTGELVGYDNEAHAVFVLQVEGFKVRNRIAGLGDPTAVDEGIVTRPLAEQMIRTAVSASAATKQDKLTSANAGIGIAITGSTQISVDLAAGERMTIVSGNTVAQLRYFDITNITGGTVTLEAGHAYRLNATTGTKTLYAENMADDKFGLEGHIEIFVANTGSIQTGKLAGGTTEVILADALEPDAVNNCTVRFHDHKAIISVEDHVAGHIVTVSAGTAANSLYYWLTQPNTAGDAATQYIGFDATLNGTPVNFEGAANTAVKHVVGNGYAQTLLTGNVAPAAALTVSDLGLQNVTVTGGTLTLGDAYIPNGSTVAVSGGALAVEKVTGNGGVIDLGGERVNVYRQSATIQNVTLTNGKYDASPAAIYVQSSGTLVCNNTTFTDNIGSGAAIVGTYRDDWSVVMSGCSIYGNTAKFGGGIDVSGSGTMNLVDCFVKGNTATNPSGNNTGDIFIETGATVIIDGGTIGTVCENAAGNPQLKGYIVLDAIYPRSNGVAASVTISSGAILDLTGNTNTTPVAPGGGITLDASPSSGVVIIGSAGSTTQTRTFAGGGTITGSAVTKIGAISGATVTLPSSSCQIEFVKSGETVVSSAFIQASETPYVLETQQGTGAVLVRASED